MTRRILIEHDDDAQTWSWEFPAGNGNLRPAVLAACAMPPIPTVSGGAHYVAKSLLPMRGKYDLHLIVVGDRSMKAIIEKHIDRYAKFFRSLSLVARDKKPSTVAEAEKYYAERIEHGLPFLDISFYSSRVIDVAKKIIQKHRIALFELHSTHLAYLKHFFPHIPALLASHNMEMDLFPFWIRGDSLLGETRQNEVAAQSRKNAREVEIENRWGFEAMTFISREDMYRVTAPVEKQYLPLCFPIRTTKKMDGEGAVNVLWLGSFDWYPNAEGISWFFNSVFPLLKSYLEEKNIRFHLVGNSPPKDAAIHEDGKHVFFHGFVERIDQFLNEADILIAPLLTGSGVRVKILEAMSRGIPVICTSRACKGIWARHGEQVWIADEPRDFAEGLLRLTEDPALRKKISEKSTELLRRSYNPEAAIRMKHDIYGRLLAGKTYNPMQNQMRSPYDGLTHLKPIAVNVIDKDYSPRDGRPFSVVIPIKNEGDNLRSFMSDLAAQTLQPTEIIIIDHNSKDNSLQIIEEEKNKNALPITVLKSDENPEPHSAWPRTVAENRNYGVSVASSDLLVFTDAGNGLPPFFFANMVGPFSENPNLEMVGGIYYGDTPRHTATYVYNWETVDWNIFLPAARALAVKKEIFIKAGGFPSFLTFAGEDALFDVKMRTICSVWTFNKKAWCIWDAPATKKEMRKKYYTYGVGDGESGLGDFIFGRTYNYLCRYGSIPPGITVNEPHYCAFQGYLKGRLRRGEIDRARRNIKKIAVVPLEKHPCLVKSSLALINKLTNDNRRVICVIASEEQLPFSTPEYANFDFTLCELHYMSVFDICDFLGRYSYPPINNNIDVIEDENNIGENVRKFVLRLKCLNIF